MKRLTRGTLILVGLSLWLGPIPIARADTDISVKTVSPPPALTDRDKKQMADEIKQGQDAAAEVLKSAKLVKDKAENDRVDQIGQRLAAVVNTTEIPAGYGNDRVFPFVWHFHIVDDKAVNAFSLPGGQVYINSGLLKDVRSDDELAGVLGHEMTHSAHHHIQALSHEQSKMSTAMMAGLLAAILAHVPSQDIGNLAAGAQYTALDIMNTKYSQAAERDADHGGTIMMAKAGFNPVGMLTFMQRLGDFENASPQVTLGILQDHPEAADRVAAITRELAEMNVPVTVSSIRKVTDAPHAVAHQDPAGGIDIVFANHTLPTLADPDGNRIPAIVSRFNTSLDSGLQLYQVEASGSQVLLSDQPLITILPADLALHPGETSAALAQAATDALRGGIYSQAFPSSKM
jgi:hypothetical protein